MKRLLLFPLYLFLLNQEKSVAQQPDIQYTYSDARYLKELYLSNETSDSLDLSHLENVNKFLALFKKYGNYDSLDSKILIASNPFIDYELIIKTWPVKKNSYDIDYLSEPVRSHEEVAGMMGQSQDGKSINPFSWQSTVLDGTARFLAERFKDELAAYYLTTFYKKIENKPVITTLFPKTVEFLKAFAYQIYNTDIATLQVAAETDLDNFPKNFIRCIDHIENMKDKALIKAGLSSSLDIYNDLNEDKLIIKMGRFMVQLINHLPEKKHLDKSYSTYYSVLRILSNAFLERKFNAPSDGWIDLNDNFFEINEKKYKRADIKSVKTNKDISFINNQLDQSFLFALLYEQLKDLKFAYEGHQKKTLKEYFGGKRELWEKWFSSLSNFYPHLRSMQWHIDKQDYLASTTKSNPDKWETIFKTADLTNAVFPFLDNNPAPGFKLPLAVNNVSRSITPFYNILKNASNKKYSFVIPEIIMLLTGLDSSVTNDKIIPYMRYASVLAQFTLVKTPEEMKDLLQSVALPIGSASIKRKSKFNISLNAYVGFAGGTEVARSKQFKQSKTSLGLSAPMGFAISNRFGSQSKKIKDPFIPSGTLFLSVLDIGNLVNIRLNSDTASIGNVKFSHFVSLGAGYYINFRNSPFTAGLSWSYVPGYRDFKADNKWVYKADANRIRLSLLVDIPLFNVYTKTVD